MTPSEYEQVVHDIVDQIRANAPELAGSILGFGRRCKVMGVSGYHHQIDVALETDTNIYLIECKRWEDRIGVDVLLVLAARVHDVQQSRPGKHVRGILTSTNGATPNAKKLAVAFEVEIEIVRSTAEFGMRIGKRTSVGIADHAKVTDSFFGTITRNDGTVETFS